MKQFDLLQKIQKQKSQSLQLEDWSVVTAEAQAN